jgi:hypothetical protein
MRRLAVVLALCPATLAAQATSAPASATTGILFGGAAIGASLHANGQTDNGVGGGGTVGVGVTPHFALVGGYHRSRLGAAGGRYFSSQIDAGARVHFLGVTSRVRPYVEALATRLMLSDRGLDSTYTRTGLFSGYYTRFNYTLDASGLGLTLGGGALVYFIPQVALNIGVNATRGTFSDWNYQGQTVTDARSVDATNMAFRLGVAYWPMGHR